MRKVVVYYTDSMDHHEIEYMAGPYTGDLVKDVQRNLSLMGCADFRIEPYIEKKRA